jgi:Fur family ferric uptake transcriptional regulator
MRRRRAWDKRQTAARERRDSSLRRRPVPARTAGRASLHALINTMRARGLRVSTARRRVLAALLAAERPPGGVPLGGGCPVAAVYRNLETLESIGLVEHVHLGHGAGRYALRGAGGWAACQACGEAVRLAPGALERIRAAVREACGFDAPFNHFPVVGLCPDCRPESLQGAPSWHAHAAC